MKRLLLLLALAVKAGAAESAALVSVEIIVHPDSEVTTIDRSELSKIFLKRLRTWDNGEPALPVDQIPGSAARDEFSRTVHSRSVVTVEVYWKRMIFSGKAVPPPEVATDAEVVEYVRSHPGAVGYVGSSTPLEGVRALEVIE